MSYLGNLSSLSCQELAVHFQSFPLQVRKFSNLFLENEVDGPVLELFENVEELNKYLQDLGINEPGQITIITKSLKKLNDSFTHSRLSQNSPLSISPPPLSLSDQQMSASQSQESIQQTPQVLPVKTLPSGIKIPLIEWTSLSGFVKLSDGQESTILIANWNRGPFAEPQQVAIKVFNPKPQYDMVLEKCLTEAEQLIKVSGQIFDPSLVVHVYGVCEAPSPQELSLLGSQLVGLVMRFEVGGTLQENLRSPFTLLDKTRMLMQLCQVLSETHGCLVAHGDLKPENIVLNSHKDIVLLDFGQSAMNETVINLTLSRAGTPLYCDLERLGSDAMGLVEPPSRKGDIYSFGLIAWQVLTGQLSPFGDNTPASLQILREFLSSGGHPDQSALCSHTSEGVSEVPPMVTSLLERCWSPTRNERPTAMECLSVFRHWHLTLKEEQFDIFFSHPWVDKKFLCHVYYLLSQLGYRIFYDQNNLGHDLKGFMSRAIENSQVVVACLNKRYQASESCRYELHEARRLGKKIVSLFVDEDRTPSVGHWMDNELRDLTVFLDFMYTDIGELAGRDWSDSTPESTTSFSPSLPSGSRQWNLTDLSRNLDPLVHTFKHLGIRPSLTLDQIDRLRLMKGNGAGGLVSLVEEENESETALTVRINQMENRLNQMGQVIQTNHSLIESLQTSNSTLMSSNSTLSSEVNSLKSSSTNLQSQIQTVISPPP